MIDSHCHLTDKRLQSQLPDVLLRAKQAGVERMVTIGTHLPDIAAAIALCESLPNVKCAIGIHPNNSAEATLADVAKLRGLQQSPTVVALGEMGLDYHWKDVPPAQQRIIFEAQLQLATELDRPVVIHCREAVDDTLAMMKTFPKISAVIHCFTGTPAEAENILTAGYLLGFTGPITYKNAGQLIDVVKLTPLDRILVETDAPYLSPEPMRKIKTNEPSFVAHTLAKLAELKGVSVEEADRVTTANTLKFYRWDHWPRTK